MKVLKEDHTISHDWEGKQYIGLTIDWDYEKQEVHISITGYIEDALTQFKHSRLQKPQINPTHTFP